MGEIGDMLRRVGQFKIGIILTNMSENGLPWHKDVIGIGRRKDVGWLEKGKALLDPQNGETCFQDKTQLTATKPCTPSVFDPDHFMFAGDISRLRLFDKHKSSRLISVCQMVELFADNQKLAIQTRQLWIQIGIGCVDRLHGVPFLWTDAILAKARPT